MKILVTAFEPFGGKGYNPSRAMVEGLHYPADTEICILPTSYAGAAKKLNEQIDRVKPDCAVLTGVASGRREVCLEFCALNIKDAAIPDNDGEKASGQCVIPGKDNALFTTLDLCVPARQIREAGIPCRVSYHAGTFVCNSTYYHLLSRGIPGVFMHIPDDERSRPDENAPYHTLEDSRRALTILLSVLRGIKA